MSTKAAQAQSAKRMQLSRDQKALLETVYAMEKLPDAAPEGRRERWAPAPTPAAAAESPRWPPPPADPGGTPSDGASRVTDANAAIVALLLVIELSAAPPVITL